MLPIKDYFLIGDLHTAALVSAKGSIEWLCFPAFDSPSVFAAILDKEKGGAFSIDAPGFEVHAHYLPETAIVETVFSNEEQSFSVRDFMLPRPTEDVVPHFLVRKVTGVRGSSEAKFVFDPRPEYAKQQISLKKQDENLYLARTGERSLWLHVPKGSTVSRLEGGSGLEIIVSLEEGESKALIIEYSIESRLRFQGRDLEAETMQFWREWVSRGKYYAPCREGMVRSAITLKLMQFYPTGGLIAAPTTSLPETPGGERNWDYRYVWLRDATFILYGLNVMGFTEEAQKFFHFIEEIAEEFKACDDEQCEIDVPVMFTIWGQKLQHEETLDHLDGYEGARPVRIGNGASDQRQLDIYGSLIDAYYFMSKSGVTISKRGKEVVKLMVRKIEESWMHKDSGIWEVRGFIQHFTYGKVMAWVGIDRALHMADMLGISDVQKEKWEKLRHEIETWIWENCYDEEKGTFLQYPDAPAQDSTNLLFVLLHFLNRHDPKTKQIIQRTCDELLEKEVFVYRYHAKDGLTGSEGAFVLCTYWLISALAAVGELEEAERLFQKFDEDIIPPHFLIAEEVDTKNGDYLGNYPQAFSQIGYIMSAHYIQKYKSRLQRKKSAKIRNWWNAVSVRTRKLLGK